jgi:hypothetical protein
LTNSGRCPHSGSKISCVEDFVRLQMLSKRRLRAIPKMRQQKQRLQLLSTAAT